MSISLILAHPKPGSFNHAIADAATDALQSNGYRVNRHDLYAEGFDCRFSFEDFSSPSPPLQSHLKEIASAEGIVVVHPNWWGQPPAILKAWLEKVMQPGVAYRFEEGGNGGVPTGLLEARVALVFNTSDTPPEREQQVFGDPLESIWRECVFGFCGVKSFERRMFSVLFNSSSEAREGWLEEVRDIANRHFPRLP